MKKGFDFDINDMTEQQAMQQADVIIFVVFVFAGAWSLVVYFIFQGLFIFAIKKVMRAQSTLENYFMGPEVQPIAQQIVVPQV
jgi:hypothetical protein